MIAIQDEVNTVRAQLVHWDCGALDREQLRRILDHLEKLDWAFEQLKLSERGAFAALKIERDRLERYEAALKSIAGDLDLLEGPALRP